MSTSNPSELFQHRRTPAKTVQSVMFWLFRVATYFILAAATYLFLKITYEGSITLFSTKAPFINIPFLTERPQTLYVFQWDDASLTEDQLASVAEVEEGMRAKIPVLQAEFETKIQESQSKQAETKKELKAVEGELKRLKKASAKLSDEEAGITKKIERFEKTRLRVYTKDTNDPSLAEMQVTVNGMIGERQEVQGKRAEVDKEISTATARRNELSAFLPKNVKKEYQRVMGNLEAALAWPAEGFFEEQNAAEAKVTSKFDGEIAGLKARFERRISNASGDKQSRLEEAFARRLTDLETEKEKAIAKAQSIEVGDIKYRGIYAEKVEAAGLKVSSYSYSGGGIFPAIAGTVLLVIGSMIIALTLGIFSAIYLSEYAKPGNTLNLIRLSILNLAGVPSIVFGLFGLGMFVLFLDWNVSLLAGCFTLAFMVLPVIITASEESLRSIPQGFREGSLALGATKWTSIRTNVLPYALPGILTSSVLGVARVAGETAPIMFTAAYALRDNLPWEGLDNPFQFFMQGVMALPYHIYVVSSKIPQNEYTERMQYGTAFVFLVIVAGIALTSILLRIRMRKKYKW